MSEFTVSMCRLILIHKVHIDGIVWNLAIILRMKMKQRFSEFLKPHDP